MNKQEFLSECASISSGTIAHLTGHTRYEQIDFIQSTWVKWLAGLPAPEKFPSWAEAWNAWRKISKNTMMVSGYALIEGHGHLHFEAQVKTRSDDFYERIVNRAYRQHKERSPKFLPPISQVSSFDGVELKEVVL